jgi:hypothetical protein
MDTITFTKTAPPAIFQESLNDRSLSSAAPLHLTTC